MKYDFYSLSLLSSLEKYLPLMTNDDLIDILEFGIPPAPWKIKEWDRVIDGRNAVIESAISRQK